MLIFVYLEGDAAFEVEPDSGLDITAVLEMMMYSLFILKK